MDTLNSSTTPLSNKQLESIEHWTLEEWQKNSPKLLPDQISNVLSFASHGKDPNNWKNKLHILIETLNTPEQLEALGQSISFEQIYEILTLIASNKESHANSNQTKLFPIFIGMSQQLFVLLLLNASSEQQNILKEEALSESIQHQLTLLSHNLTGAIDSIIKSYNELEKQLETFDFTNLEPAQVNEKEKEIEFLQKACLQANLLCNKALALAWNSNRTDIIEALSKLKEQSQKLSTQAIGHHEYNGLSACGLYEVLENRLNSVFNDENNRSLNGDEPILEALVRFSLWYIKDYWEMGLLPHIIDPAKLELDSHHHTESDRIEYRKTLFAEVERNLHKLGLSTLNDLKLNKIYSKAILKDYIEQKI